MIEGLDFEEPEENSESETEKDPEEAPEPVLETQSSDFQSTLNQWKERVQSVAKKEKPTNAEK